MSETPRGLKITGAIALAAIISALFIVAISPARPKQQPPVAAPTFQEDPIAPKGVRLVPIVRKIEDRIPIDPTPVGDTTIQKSPPRVAAQKADVPLPPLLPKIAPEPPPLTAAPPKPTSTAALPEPEQEPEIHRHWHKAEHHAEHHTEHHAAVDVCELHHMHKVFTHEGKSWRCRK